MILMITIWLQTALRIIKNNNSKVLKKKYLFNRKNLKLAWKRRKLIRIKFAWIEYNKSIRKGE